MTRYTKFSDKGVKEVFNSYPKQAKEHLMVLRELIFEVANKTDCVARLIESLKWNEPSYLAIKSNNTKSGSAIRLGYKSNDPLKYHLYVNCNTKLIKIFKELYPSQFEYGTNRMISFDFNVKPPMDELSHIIEICLTYNLIAHSLSII